MTTKTKILVASLAVIVTGSIVGYTMYQRNRGVVAVRSGRALRQDLTQTVSANGEIKPKNFVNIGSNAFGRIVQMPVKEGDQVRAGQLLIRLEAIQTEADVRGAEAGLDASQAEIEGMSAQARSGQAAVNTARAEVARAEADLNRVQQAFNRAEQLSRDGLISREQLERAKSEFDVASAQVNASRARLAQSQAQADQVTKQSDSLTIRLNQQRAALTRARDQLSKTTILSPLEGIITNLPVHEGEIAIVGVQNQPGTTLMTIADMSIITAEVQVDETDIVNLKLGQEAQIRVDALGENVLLGHVSEIGNTALTRGPSGNQAANAQEAKNFKVVITLDNPPPELRPGLSCTASIVTATRSKVLTIPIQAITVREFDVPGEMKKEEREGVYVINNGVVLFRAVKTGIVGTTDIEITEGLNDGEEIVTGNFQALRTLQDNTRIRIEQ
jgi:HlyD family secretion protein